MIELFICIIMIRLILIEIVVLIFCKNEYFYFDLVGEIYRLWLLGRIFFFIGVGRNGKRVDFINFLIEFFVLV